MPNRQVKIGVRAKDLEDNGLAYDGGSFMPQIPDYLGYVLGLLIIWLVYTSYNTAVETVREPIAKISKQAVAIKKTVVEYAETTKAEKSLTPATSELESEEEEVGFWYRKLELINSAISWAVDYVSNTVQEMFPSEFDEEDSNPIDHSRQRLKRGDSSTNSMSSF